jgi:general secretion pathway protein B
LVTFAAMGGFSRHAPAAQVPAVVAMTAPAVVAPYYPVTQMPAAKPAQAPSSEPTGASAVPKPRAKPLPTFPAKAGRAAKVPAPHPASGHPSPVHAAPVQASPLPEAAAAVAPAQTRQELRVTGIAWQNNGESSFAVVNGRAVTKGGTVDGFKVVEIHQDTVRFSGSGGSFDVPLGETNN